MLSSLPGALWRSFTLSVKGIIKKIKIAFKKKYSSSYQVSLVDLEASYRDELKYVWLVPTLLFVISLTVMIIALKWWEAYR